MSADQNQHYLPQSYQRGWADAARNVHVYQWRHDKLVCKPKSTKSTGGSPGLYYIPMAPPGQENRMEDVFWRLIDQWGADGLALLRSNDLKAASKINKEHLATFIMSFYFRNPRMVNLFNERAKEAAINGCLKNDYAVHRLPHEPPTFEEFVRALDQPGMTELAAKTLRAQVLNNAIRTQILSMDWHVVTVTNNDLILTSDVPLITFKGLKDPDGCLILPLSSTEFFVAFNRTGIDMQSRINAAIQSGQFVRSMNMYVVQSKINFVYGVDDSQMEFVARHWSTSSKLI